jgi:hypothetical protein
MVDFSQEVPFLVTDTYFGVDVKGLFFDKALGVEEPSVAIPTMPMKMTDHAEKFQAFVSTYAIDSLFSSYLEVADIKFTIDSDEVSQLNTSNTTVNLLLPGIKTYYGADIPLEFEFEVTSMGEVQIAAADSTMSGVANIDWHVYADKLDGTRELAASITLGDLNFGFSALVNEMNLAI